MVQYEKIRNGKKYVQLVQDIYKGSETVVRCAIGTTGSFKVKVGLHQGSAIPVSLFLCTVMMNRITDNVSRESPWAMLIADDILICEETRKEVERRLTCKTLLRCKKQKFGEKKFQQTAAKLF